MGTMLEIIRDVEREAVAPPEDQFWTIKRQKTDPTKYRVLPDITGFIEYLKSLGFCYEAASEETVRVKDGIVSKVNRSAIKRTVQQDVANFPDILSDGIERDEVMAMVMNFEAKLFKDNGVLEFLPFREFDWLKATKSTSYHAYKNGVVKTTADGIELIPYSEIEGRYIWESQILDRDFELVDPEGGDWPDFVWKASGQSDVLIENFNNALGYLLHGHKDPANAFLVVFGEAVDDSDLGGGSGKSLTTKGIGKILNTATKDMRSYSPSDAFAWSSVTNATQLLILSDLKRNFSHEVLYNLVTDDFEVNAKNQPVRVYPFKESPKMVATTNYSLNVDSSHGNRRIRLVEFSSFWNEGRTPLVEYGKLLFGDDWEAEQWKKFDSYMMLTVSQYLKNGFPRIAESETSRRKRILEEKGNQDIKDWLADYRERDFKKFAEVYLSYSQSRYVTGKPIGKNVFLKRLEAVTSILDKQVEVAENGNVKFIKIW